MSATRDPDEILAAWLDEGPLTLPSQTRRAIDVALPTTVQRRSFFGWPSRSAPMNLFTKLALGAIVIAIVAVGGAALLSPSGPNGSGVGAEGATASPTATPAPVPTPSPTPVPTPSPTVGTTGWLPFTSERYRYQMSYPVDWSTEPSSRSWSLDEDRTDWLSTAADQFKAPGDETLFTVFSAPMAAGKSPDQWIADYFSPDPAPSKAPCAPKPEDVAPVSVDGHPATFWGEPETDFCGSTYAFVPVGDQMYAFVAWRGGKEALVTAFLSTVRFER